MEADFWTQSDFTQHSPPPPPDLLVDSVVASLGNFACSKDNRNGILEKELSVNNKSF